ncbi:MAG: chemotaxis protein CheB [Methylomonas sp.]
MGPRSTPNSLSEENSPPPSQPQDPLDDTSARELPLKQFNNYVVAIGASAGGLDALERFFDEMQVNSGAAFVVIQHLSPDHKSMMDNLLSRHTSMPVVVAENGMNLEENRVYLIPPGKNMTVAGKQLRLIPKNPHVFSLPIDLFFTSLSKEFGNLSIGVILSGTGSDGTRGAVAINDAGGFLLAQDPETAKFDGMPRSVIATGLVDEIMSPEMLAGRILSHILDIQDSSPKNINKGATPESGNPMEGIFHLLYQVGAVNFREYKPATVQRRIERRMQVRHVRDLENYLHLLESDRTEVATLKRDILICVTSFFRDEETFALLSKLALSNIVQEHNEIEPIRVWIAGCSTGEEAYTIAILFAEIFDKLKRWPQLKIFATDVEQQYIDIASAGVYSEAIVNEVSPERLERFFVRKGNQFAIKPEIHQNIVFARHNILDDPPFTRMDLVSCRNTLIYFENNAQEKAMLRFQYALSSNGFLLLGASESIGNRQKDFSSSSAKHKLYRVLRPVVLPLDLKSTSNLRDSNERKRQSANPIKKYSSEASVIDSGLSLLMRSYAPPALLVNHERELIHVYGDVQRYLRIPEGQASLDISKLLVGKLAPVAVALIHKGRKDNISLRSEIITLESVDRLRLVVRPVENDNASDSHFLVSFELEPLKEDQILDRTETLDISAESSERIQNLERELSVTRDTLQATIEELETSNEELQATNEELMASNEELQSTNEELQSVNEELYTVNAENQEKIEILNRLNDDLDNMTKAALIPTIFVDSSLKLTRFTPEATNIFRIRNGDVGRPIDDFSHAMEYPEFIADLNKTIETAQIIEREVKTANNDWYLARILPYIDRPKNIAGAVVTFFNVSSVKDAQRLQGILDSLPEHIAVLDPSGRITQVNKAWRDFAEHNGERSLANTGVGVNYLEVCRADQGIDADLAQKARQGIRDVLDKQINQFSLKYPCHSPTEQRWFLMHVAPVNHIGGAVVSHINITHWVLGKT